jgi:hypothetical protein
MTLVEFNSLDYEAKLFKVINEGFFLENYVTSQIRINLYSLHKFYVELVYDSDNNKMVEIRSFQSGQNLDKFINLQKDASDVWFEAFYTYNKHN